MNKGVLDTVKRLAHILQRWTNRHTKKGQSCGYVSGLPQRNPSVSGGNTLGGRAKAWDLTVWRGEKSGGRGRRENYVVNEKSSRTAAHGCR